MTSIRKIPAEPARCNVPEDQCPHGEALRELRQDVHIIKTALVGDIQTGRPGLLDQTRGLKEDVRALKAAERNRKKWFGGVIAAAVTSVVGSAAAWVFGR